MPRKANDDIKKETKDTKPKRKFYSRILRFTL